MITIPGETFNITMLAKEQCPSWKDHFINVTLCQKWEILQEKTPVMKNWYQWQVRPWQTDIFTKLL